jgi:hypothetical protein
VTYTANNYFNAGQTITVAGLATAFNLSGVTIESATPTEFRVLNSATGTTITKATVTAAVSTGTGTFTYTANNSFTNGQAITVRGMSNSSANVSGTVSGATSTSFTFTGQSNSVFNITGQTGSAGANGSGSIPAGYTYLGGTANPVQWAPAAGGMPSRSVIDIAHPYGDQEVTFMGTSVSLTGSAGTTAGAYSYVNVAEGLIFTNSTNAYYDVTVWVYGYNNV